MVKDPTSWIVAFAVGLLLLAGLAGGETPAAPAAPAAPAGPACQYTYDNFGATFLNKYCLECHASTHTSLFGRKGAPKGIDFDDRKVIAAKKKGMIEQTVVKKSMPPWFATGGPELFANHRVRANPTTRTRPPSGRG